ncbi:hypothetical protein D3C87_1713780 [compost metagenome]
MVWRATIASVEPSAPSIKARHPRWKRGFAWLPSNYAELAGLKTVSHAWTRASASENSWRGKNKSVAQFAVLNPKFWWLDCYATLDMGFEMN